MCEFINEGGIKCACKNKYGNYCNKHKREYLVVNDFIIVNKFTNKYSDYLKDDILNTLSIIDKKKYKKSFKKDVLFKILSNKIEKFKYYNENNNSIIKVQRYFRYKYKKINSQLRGPGFLNKKSCNNNEDFFTYETINELDEEYFFSYKDDYNVIWFFDIRSLMKLIEMNQPNPYTMVPFNNEILLKCNKLIDYLKSRNITLTFIDEMKELKKDKKNILKQKMVDLSANIERTGYSFNIEWFTLLNTIQLKKLYYILEDIWNYRANLSIEMKIKMCPPNGIVFNKSHNEIRQTNSKDTMRDNIVSDILKFNNAQDNSDERLGYMLFLMGLGTPPINPSICEVHPWILHSI